jgi:hypothetical protein
MHGQNPLLPIRGIIRLKILVHGKRLKIPPAHGKIHLKTSIHGKFHLKNLFHGSQFAKRKTKNRKKQGFRKNIETINVIKYFFFEITIFIFLFSNYDGLSFKYFCLNILGIIYINSPIIIYPINTL